MRAKKWKRIVPGFTAVIAALFLCIPVMAGGYTVSSALKVNSIGISSWVKEYAGADNSFFDISPDTQLGERLSTSSNASKSNAVKGSDFSGKLATCLTDKDKKESFIAPATPSNGERKADEKAQEKEHIEEVKQKKASASESNAELSE